MADYIVCSAGFFVFGLVGGFCFVLSFCLFVLNKLLKKICNHPFPFCLLQKDLCENFFSDFLEV